MKKIWLGISMIVIAMVLTGASVWYFIANMGSGFKPFLAPGQVEFVIGADDGGVEKAHTVSLWLDYRTFYQGKYYSGGDDPSSGLKFILRDAAGKEYPLVPASMSSELTTGTTSRRLVAESNVPAGKYALAVEGKSGEQVFSVVIDNNLMFVILFFVGALFISIGLFLGGIVLIIVGVVCKKPQPPQLAALPQD